MSRTPETTYAIMSAIKSKNTEPERILGSALWKLGLRYRKHAKLPGKPDFIFNKVKLIVFCDGDFWHGNNWRIRGIASLEEELSSYSDFWRKKILRNIERDKEVNKKLSDLGWYIMRFWESEIRDNPSSCADKVKSIHNKLLCKLNI